MSRARSATDNRWWLTADGDAQSALWTCIRALRERQRPRRDMYLFWMQLFGVSELAGLGLTNYDSSHAGFVPATMPFNLVRNGVKTIVSKVAKNRPLPMALTTRGDYKQTRRARGLSRYLEGEFARLKMFQQTPGIARDACTFGTGILHVFRRRGDDRPSVERIFPWEILVDAADGRYGRPRTVYLVRWRDRTELQGMFPDKAEEIDRAASNAGSIEDVVDYDDTADVVLTVEAWHLPPPKRRASPVFLEETELQDAEPVVGSDTDRNDTETRIPTYEGTSDSEKDLRRGVDRGRYVLAIDGETLLDEDYERDYFPFPMLRYDDPVIGFWGDGLAGELSGFQYEINYVSETLHLAHRVVGTGIWLVPDGADILDGHFQNDTGYVLRYKQGFKPEYVNPEPVNPQTYNYIDFLTQRGLNFSGISQTSAQSQKPAGITAAKALQVLDEVEADRFALFEKAWEDFHLEIANQLIDVMKDIADEFGDVETRVPSRKALLAVKWSDVDMDRDAFVMQTWPTSLLARTPSARLQQVQDLFSAGIIDKPLFLKLLDAPDIDAETDLMAAAQQVVDEQIEKMLDAEDPNAADAQQQPDAWSDLTYALYRGAQQVALGKLQGVADANLDLLKDFVQNAKDLLDKRMGAQAAANGNSAPAATPGGAPPAPGQQPPQAPIAPLQGNLQGQAA